MASDGDPSSGASAAPSAQPASVSDETGGIEGLITDEEFRPVAGALVGILDQPNVQATADDAGRFSLSNVAPGSVVLAIQALGFEAATKRVDVVAGQVTSDLHIQLVAISIEGPWAEPLIHKGIIKNGVGVIRTATCQNCGSSETYYRFKDGMPEDFAGLLIESRWTARDYLGLDLVDRQVNGTGASYWRIRAPAPVRGFMEPCKDYTAAPHYAHSPMPCGKESFADDHIQLETWYIGDFQEETHNLDPVCQVPVGPVPGYKAGCYGLGFMPELVFTHYLTIFHMALPPDVEKFSSAPDG